MATTKAPSKAARDENMLKIVRFEKPDWINMRFHINGACYNHYPLDTLAELMTGHPLLFPDYDGSPLKVPEYTRNQKAGVPYTDPWGCVWETSEDGITGAVAGHPLADWSDFDSYTPPDPEKSNGLHDIDWEKTAREAETIQAQGGVYMGGLRHGHTFLQLCDLRGYENLLFDMYDEHEKLPELIDMVTDFNLALVKRQLSLGAGWMGYPEDLGMQVGPMLSPELFDKYILPAYRRIITPAREAGCIIHMHSDGDIRSLLDSIIDGGVQSINLQDLVNGIDWIRDTLKGKVAIDLDIDRQKITRFGTPEEIDALIREEVEKLGSPEGGLSMVYGLYPGIPLENVKALMDTMEKYAFHYSG